MIIGDEDWKDKLFIGLFVIGYSILVVLIFVALIVLMYFSLWLFIHIVEFLYKVLPL